MGTNNLTIKQFDKPEEAPRYNLPEYKYANLEEAVIVRKGTVGGNPTVDLVFEDEKGQKYIAMTTGTILKALAQALG